MIQGWVSVRHDSSGPLLLEGVGVSALFVASRRREML